jgi:succinyl-CoA synthetase beta subunit
VAAHDLVQNENLKALHIIGIDGYLTAERFKEICQKYGQVQYVKLKHCHLLDGRRGKSTAQVFYMKKEEAGQAIQKLYYEKELGENINIDFFKLKEARILE